jgi:hypothetical protein
MREELEMAMPTQPASGTARMLALSGVAAVVLVVASFAGLGGDTPGSEDSAAKISAYYDSHEVREMIAAFVLAASAPFFVLFAVTLAASLRGNGRTIWDRVLTLGSAAAGGGFIIAGMVHVALAQTANNSGVAGGALQALAGLDESSWVAFNAGLGVLMLGAAGSLLAHRVAPVRAWIALVAGIALFIPFADFVALIVSGLWIIATSIILFRRERAIVAAPQLA